MDIIEEKYKQILSLSISEIVKNVNNDFSKKYGCSVEQVLMLINEFDDEEKVKIAVYCSCENNQEVVPYNYFISVLNNARDKSSFELFCSLIKKGIINTKNDSKFCLKYRKIDKNLYVAVGFVDTISSNKFFVAHFENEDNITIGRHKLKECSNIVYFTTFEEALEHYEIILNNLN